MNIKQYLEYLIDKYRSIKSIGLEAGVTLFSYNLNADVIEVVYVKEITWHGTDYCVHLSNGVKFMLLRQGLDNFKYLLKGFGHRSIFIYHHNSDILEALIKDSEYRIDMTNLRLLKLLIKIDRNEHIGVFEYGY